MSMISDFAISVRRRLADVAAQIERATAVEHKGGGFQEVSGGGINSGAMPSTIMKSFFQTFQSAPTSGSLSRSASQTISSGDGGNDRMSHRSGSTHGGRHAAGDAKVRRGGGADYAATDPHAASTLQSESTRSKRRMQARKEKWMADLYLLAGLTEAAIHQLNETMETLRALNEMQLYAFAMEAYFCGLIEIVRLAREDDAHVPSPISSFRDASHNPSLGSEYACSSIRCAIDFRKRS